MLHVEQPQGVPETIPSITLIFGLLRNIATSNKKLKNNLQWFKMMSLKDSLEQISFTTVGNYLI